MVLSVVGKVISITVLSANALPFPDCPHGFGTTSLRLSTASMEQYTARLLNEARAAVNLQQDDTELPSWHQSSHSFLISRNSALDSQTACHASMACGIAQSWAR